MSAGGAERPPSGPPASPAMHYREIVLATGSRGKLLEIRAILGDLAMSLRSLDAFPDVLLPEEGDDYEANAVAKARTAARQTGRLALGDDSGLEVEALAGGPGPRSARYGGAGLDDAGRNARLLADLASATPEGRRARFVCVAALSSHEGETVVVRGECVGRILEAPRGRGGFGYDPIFEVEGSGRSMAELAPADKNALSHRGRAFAALRDAIRARLSPS